MGRIVIIKDFARALRENGARVSDVIVDPGGGNNITGEHFSSAGDDTFPLTTDYAFAANNQRKGGSSIVGYIDPINIPKALSGEKRIYARDSNGDAICEIWLKADGSILISNDNGNAELKADGKFFINGKEFGVHIHTQGNDSAGDTQVNTGVPV